MRAHGIGDESAHIDDEDQASDWEDKLGANVPPSNKRMYALRTNPNRLKSCRVCENCGKEFLSWKSFLEHGKCSSEDAESLVSSPCSEGDDDNNGNGNGRRAGCGSGWSKRKRSLRASKAGNFNNSHHCLSSEEEDLANCLMMLSNAAVDPSLAEAEESCASASKDEEQQRTRHPMNFIAPISCSLPQDNNNKAKGVAKGLFECKACKKVFNSHQALGGHRASHKKVKGCFAARLDHLDDSLADNDVITHEEFFPAKSNSTLQFDHGSNAPFATSSKRKSKVHECSICHRIFSSGQALGGHKRCHWITSNSTTTPDASVLAKFHHFQETMEQVNNNNNNNQRAPKLETMEALDLKLDLNLPAPVDELAGGRPDQHLKRHSFEMSTEMYLQPWIGVKEEENNQNRHQQTLCQKHQNDNDNINDDEYKNNNNNNNSINGSMMMQNVDDEADSKVKLAKLSELKDINTNEGCSPWLQVGIGSTTDVGADP